MYIISNNDEALGTRVMRTSQLLIQREREREREKEKEREIGSGQGRITSRHMNEEPGTMF
jgi:hypothetical protein